MILLTLIMGMNGSRVMFPATVIFLGWNITVCGFAMAAKVETNFLNIKLWNTSHNPRTKTGLDTKQEVCVAYNSKVSMLTKLGKTK